MATSISTLQPGLGLTAYLTTSGIFPPPGDGSGFDGWANNGYIGAVHFFGGNFAPGSASDLSGTLINISSNSALFSIIGTTYGGNGTTNFAVPDLRARIATDDGPLHFAGQRYGAAGVTLTQNQLPVTSGGISAPVDGTQPSLALKYFIAAQGIFPSNGGSGGADMIGNILVWAGNSTPAGYIEADGRLLDIGTYDVLYNLLGTTYGGDGISTFALPDLRDRAIIGMGGGVPIGATFGAATDTIATVNLPSSMGGAGVPISTRQPSIALNYLIATQGFFPSQGGGGTNDESIPYLGEIIISAVDVVPRGFARADGSLLSIQTNQALFAILGTTYGGNGTTNFALPDLRGRAPVKTGTDPGTGLAVALGQVLGSETFTITAANIPPLTIPGTPANESFYGGADTDSLAGAAGNDRILGNDGNDTINGGAGNDTLDGGLGTDTLTYAGITGGVTISLGVTTPQVTGGAGTDTIANFENLVGGSGHDSLTGDAGNNNIQGGAGNDTIEGGAGDDVLDGGADTDTLSYAGATAGITIRLTQTTPQATGGVGTDTIANFENVTGGSGNDVLVGTSLANVIIGGAGDDQVTGGLGNDTIDGGPGNDTLDGGSDVDWLVYTSATAGVTISLAVLGTQVTGGAGNDSITGFENLLGSGFDDSLTGTAFANIIQGAAGNDTIDGGDGDDTLDGGDGIDTLSYGSATIGAIVSLATTLAQSTVGSGFDTVTNFENLRGGSGNDRLSGDGGNNAIAGGAGDDVIDGGLGNDLLDGGQGNDTLSYGSATAAITASLAVTTAQNTGGAGTDTVTGFENLSGGTGNDRLTGDAAGNALSGNLGDDTLTGGLGNDSLDGGGGSDTAILSGTQGGYRLGVAGTIVITSGADGLDRFVNVENVQWGAGAPIGLAALQAISTGLIYARFGSTPADYLLPAAYAGPVTGLANQQIGSAGNDIVFGTALGDFINGGTGDDAIDGGAGNDVIDGGAGSNFLTGGAGVDQFFVEGRAAAVTNTWNTITDFTAGETVTIWGYQPGVSQFLWVANDGAAGYQGATLHYDLDGNGLIDTSVTFTGLTQAQLPTPLYGNVGGNDYVFLG